MCSFPQACPIPGHRACLGAPLASPAHGGHRSAEGPFSSRGPLWASQHSTSHSYYQLSGTCNLDQTCLQSEGHRNGQGWKPRALDGQSLPCSARARRCHLRPASPQLNHGDIKLGDGEWLLCLEYFLVHLTHAPSTSFRGLKFICFQHL